MGTTRDTTIADLAAELDLNEESVRRHIRRGAPHSKRQNRLYFNVPEYRAWMAAQGLSGERGRPSDADGGPDLDAARLRKENALAAKYELQVARERGQLLEASGVQRWINEHVVALRTRLLNLGDELTPVLEGRDSAERAEVINGRVRELLEELAREAGRMGEAGPDAAPQDQPG